MLYFSSLFYYGNGLIIKCVINIFLSTCTEVDSLTNEICIEMGIREKERYV